MSDTIKRDNFFKRTARWIGSWAVAREIGGFFGDAWRHYKLGPVSRSAVDSGKDVYGQYRSTPPRWRSGLLGLIVLAALIVCAAALYQFYYNPMYSRMLGLPMPADAIRVQMVDLSDTSGGGGQVEQSETVTLTSRINGIVAEVPVNLGDIVTTGTLLYSCDTRTFEAALSAEQEAVHTSEMAEKMAEKQDQGNQVMKKENLASEEDLLVSGSALATAKSNLAIAQEGLLNAQLDLESARVKSPVNGIVLQRMLNPRERVVTNQTVMQIGALDNVYFLALINEDKIAAIQVGLDAQVTFPAFPGQAFSGKVFFVDPKTDPSTRSFTAYIKIPNPDLKLKPGLSGFARINQNKHVLAVPDSAVMNPTGENASVFVITSDNHAVLRPVRFGMISGGWTEITSGLQEGDIVATVGPLYLQNGDKVHYSLKSDRS